MYVRDGIGKPNALQLRYLRLFAEVSGSMNKSTTCEQHDTRCIPHHLNEWFTTAGVYPSGVVFPQEFPVCPMASGFVCLE